MHYSDTQVEIEERQMLPILEDGIVALLVALFFVLFTVPYQLLNFPLCRSHSVILGWEYLILFYELLH